MTYRSVFEQQNGGMAMPTRSHYGKVVDLAILETGPRHLRWHLRLEIPLLP